MSVVSRLLVRPAGAGVERPLVQRDEEDGRVVPEDRLRPVPVVDVPVDDRDPPDARARPARDRAAIATLLKMQKPIAAVGSAWWPGGRTSAKPPCSAAEIATPAASSAASKVVSGGRSCRRRARSARARPGCARRTRACGSARRRRPTPAPASSQSLDRVEQHLEPARGVRMVSGRVEPNELGMGHDSDG